MKITFAASLALVFALLLLPCGSAQAASVQDLTWSQLQSQMRSSPKQHVVIEFYSSKADALDCDKCGQQSDVFKQAASRYGSNVAFVRIDVSTVAHLIENGTVRIYPTHLFVRHDVKQGNEVVSRTVSGFLNADQFEELISEFFEVQP